MEKVVLKKVTAADAVYEQLRSDIITLFYKPGEKLSEVKIAERYGVSRDPVRKSISRLAQEGMLESRPQIGTIVKEISMEQGREICDIRVILETYAIEKAVDCIPMETVDNLLEQYNRIYRFLSVTGEELNTEIYILDSRIHQTIYEFCGNSMIQEVICSYSHIIKRIQISNMTYHQRREGTMEEMHEIILALKDRDSKRAVAAMQRHIENIKKTLVDDA